MPALLAVAAGGFLGGLARYAVALALPPAWSTLVVNVVGAFLLGAVSVLWLELRPPRRSLQVFLGTGVLGSFTTFSTWMVDVEGMVSQGLPGLAALHLLGGLTAGLLAAVLGLLAGRSVARSWRVRGERR